MKRYIAMLAVACACSVLVVSGQVGAPQPQQDVPWAYPVNPPPPAGAPPPARGAAPPPDPAPQHLPGTDVTLSIAQTRNLFDIPDWHPTDHPAMPDVVQHGRRPDVRACGYCHLPNGQGRPENAGLAGLPVSYFLQQMADFKNGGRKSSEPRMGPPAAMIAVAKASTDEENKAAAEYFRSIAFKPWIKVVEANTVPKTRIAAGMLAPAEPAGTEPIGSRVIEVPADLARTELRDSKSGFVAYVPVGSIKKGEALVTLGGNGRTVACTVCHGSDLKGLGPVPSIAGRSPSYLVRQLYDLQHGVRAGEWSPLMKGAVAKLTLDDLVSIAAYASSREP
jgi:cytochrome c553